MYKKNIKIIMKLKGSMSHLRGKIDIEYVKDCFIDTIDNGFKVKITRDLDDSADYDFKTCIVGISLTTLKFYREEKSIENVIDEFDKVTEMTRDIKVSIDKVKIEYPDINVSIYMEPK
jgi:hypothetical protein